ncbi:MAG TPA: DNA starvation/stationary phase protection protein, partial [Williamsia sp.]
MTFTAPGLSDDATKKLIAVLQERLSAFNDLHLTLKHIHWNVVGANFIGV